MRWWRFVPPQEMPRPARLVPPPLGDEAFWNSLPAPLHGYQVEGIEALLGRSGLLLADDMGLGKTIQALLAIRLLVERGDASRCLVLTPASVSLQWRRELDRWAPGLSAIVVHGGAPRARVAMARGCPRDDRRL